MLPSLDERQIKIRLGLVLQGCIEAALRKTSFSEFVSTPKYDENSMTPDFLIPNQEHPKFVFEVTQTEARNSFQMKVLRYFEAVCEAKSHFGNEVITVNILLGDPARELPKSNVRVMYGFFDENLSPRNDCKNESDRLILENLEKAALQLARNVETPDVRRALNKVIQDHEKAVLILSVMLEQLLDRAKAKFHLFPLWNMERQRSLSQKDVTGELPYTLSYKRPILESLFLTDKEFNELVQAPNLGSISLQLLRQLAGKKMLKFNVKEDSEKLQNVFLISEEDFILAAGISNPENLPEELLQKFVTVGFVEVREGISLADRKIVHKIYTHVIRSVLFEREALKLKIDLEAAIGDEFFSELRSRCLHALNEISGVRAFFDDIRDEQRRLKMANHFLDCFQDGAATLTEEISTNIQSSIYAGIEHQRCWMADLQAAYLDVSHNDMNRAVFQDSSYKDNLGNPFNNLTVRSARLLSSDDIETTYLQPTMNAFMKLLDKREHNVDIDYRMLATRLLNLRIDGSIKLQFFNPMHLLLKSFGEEIGAEVNYTSYPNLLNDLASDIKALGKFKVFTFKTKYGTILVNALYVDKYGGLDKAKEWSARGRSFLYRLTKQGTTASNLLGMIFVADGPWKPEAVRRLRMGGWTVCRPADFINEVAGMLKQ